MATVVVTRTRAPHTRRLARNAGITFRRPDDGLALHGDDVLEPRSRELVAEFDRISVRGIGQHDVAPYAPFERTVELIERDLELGPAFDLVGNAGFASSLPITRPLFGRYRSIATHALPDSPARWRL